jgi:hypothetical protein
VVILTLLFDARPDDEYWRQRPKLAFALTIFGVFLLLEAEVLALGALSVRAPYPVSQDFVYYAMVSGVAVAFLLIARSRIERVPIGRRWEWVAGIFLLWQAFFWIVDSWVEG